MKAVVFFNNKGGVGKTTLACNVVSYISSHYNKRVLLIDADPQCNATQTILTDDVCESIYLTEDSQQKTIYNILTPLEYGEPTISSVVPAYPRSENKYKTDLLPGHPSLSILEDKLSENWNKLLGADIAGFRITNWVKQLLFNYSASYDLIVFDVGPSLGALNRTVILASDYIITPFGCDIFSILGIRNISLWIQQWHTDYKLSLQNAERRGRMSTLENYNIITDTSLQFKLAGYSVQQYVSRKFKDGPRPVKAYEKIMDEIPSSVIEHLGFLTPSDINNTNIRLGDIPYVYSLVPLSQTSKTPIHALSKNEGVVGAQYKQVNEYKALMEQFSNKLLANINLL